MKNNSMKAKKTILSNGIRLVTAALPSTKTVTVLMFFKTGSRYEDPKIQGISHFLEHMMFKGTKKRPKAIQISKLLDAIGAEFNAFTSLDHTGYYIKAASDKVELVFDVLGDILQNSLFQQAEITREKGPVIEEIKMYNENPMYFVEIGAYLNLFGENNLGRPIAGDETTVANLTRKQVVDYYRTHYFAENLIVGVAGNVSDNKVLTLARKHLSGFGQGKEQQHEPVVPVVTKPRVKLYHRPLKQVNSILAWPTVGHNHPDRHAVRVLASILGGGMSSRLFNAVRERKGLCYYINASIDHFEETGGFFIKSGLDLTRLDLALTTIFAELKKIKKQGPTKEELRDRIEHIKGRLLIDFEDSYSVVESMVQQEAFMKDGMKSIDQIIKDYEKVTVSDVKRVANAFLRRDALCLTMVGPLKDEKHFETLIQKTPF